MKPPYNKQRRTKKIKNNFEKHIRKTDILKSTPRLEILTVTIETDRHTLIIEGGLN